MILVKQFQGEAPRTRDCLSDLIMDQQQRSSSLSKGGTQSPLPALHKGRGSLPVSDLVREIADCSGLPLPDL